MSCSNRRVARPLVRAVRAIAWLVQLRLSVAVAYLLVVLAAGARDGDPRPGGRPGSMRAVTLVPAHDEELDVAAAVRSLREQAHPPDRHEVIVIADNCGDATARIAREAGATVWERHDPTQPGKGPALSWALNRLWEQRPQTEAVIVVDADCIAGPNLVSAITGALAGGADAVQANYAVSNADESTETALRAAGFILKHVVRARGRARLGLSPGLFGTGMGFSAELLRTTRWSRSVTEDTELFLQLVESGRSIAYAQEAEVRSPAPRSASDAESQQTRWETGNHQLARSRLWRLLARGLARRDREMLGAAAELALPAQSPMFAAQAAVLGVAAAARLRRLAIVSTASLAGQIGYILGGLAAAGSTRLLTRAGLRIPVFVAHRVRVVFGVRAGRRAQTWQRTTRTGSR